MKENFKNTGGEVKHEQEKQFLATFAKPLQSYKKAKLRVYEMAIRRTVTRDNVNTFAKRIEKLIIVTKGLTDAAKIDKWLKSFPSFVAPATTYQKNLRIAWEFVRDQSEQQMYDFGVLKNEI